MDRPGLRCGHTGWRSAGVVDVVSLAGGEMREDPLDELGCLDTRDDAQRTATHITAIDVDVDVDVEDSLEPLHPAHGERKCTGFAGGWMSTVGDDAVAVLEVRGEHAMVSSEMGTGRRGGRCQIGRIADLHSRRLPRRSAAHGCAA